MAVYTVFRHADDYLYVFFCYADADLYGCLCPESVAHAPDRLDVLRMGGIKFNLFTDLFDMDGYGRDVADAVHIPDPAKELILAVDVVGILRQEGEKVKFLRS